MCVSVQMCKCAGTNTVRAMSFAACIHVRRCSCVASGQKLKMAQKKKAVAHET